MEEVDPRQFRAGINLKDSFLQFILNGVSRLSASILVNKGFCARSKDSFL